MYIKIKSQIKESMKNKDVDKRDVLKMVVDKAKTIVKEKNPNDSSDSIPNEIIIQAINKELKQLRQTKDSLKGKENSELYLTTLKKISILEMYLPKMMGIDEVQKEVERILSIGDYPNFGAKMRAVMAELKGKADNKLIKEIVETFK